MKSNITKMHGQQHIKIRFAPFLSQDCKGASGTSAVADHEDVTVQVVVYLHGVICVCCCCVLQVSTAGEGSDSAALLLWVRE